MAVLVGSLFLTWQYAMTGNALTDPYTLWWSFDQVGFGTGIGLEPGGRVAREMETNAPAQIHAGVFAARDRRTVQ